MAMRCYIFQIEITEHAAGSVYSSVVGMSHGNALHPNTIDDGAWMLNYSTGFVACREFGFSVHGASSKDDPFSMQELGLDFFICAKRHPVVWFRDPQSGKIFHSAAKTSAVAHRNTPGNRYCPICHKCFSANNFKSQHLRSHYTTQPQPSVVSTFCKLITAEIEDVSQ